MIFRAHPSNGPPLPPPSPFLSLCTEQFRNQQRYEKFSYLAGMSPYISLKIKKRHYEHHMIEAHKYLITWNSDDIFFLRIVGGAVIILDDSVQCTVEQSFFTKKFRLVAYTWGGVRVELRMFCKYS